MLFGLLFSGTVGTLLGTLLAILSSDYINFVEFVINWKSIMFGFLPRILIIGPLAGGFIKPIIFKIKNNRFNKRKDVI